MALSNDQLAGFILPWAKEKHPDKYDLTLKAAPKDKTFRAYLLRLVEIRWQEASEEGASEEEKQWRLSCPISVLDETSIRMKVKRNPTGEVMEFQGSKAAGSQTHRFHELLMGPDEFDALQRAKKALDLEYVK